MVSYLDPCRLHCEAVIRVSYAGRDGGSGVWLLTLSSRSRYSPHDVSINIKQEWVCRTYRRVEKVWSGREMAGDVVERSRSEECDVGMQQRNVCPLAGGTVRLLTVLAM